MSGDPREAEDRFESATYKKRRRPLSQPQQAEMNDLFARFGLDTNGGSIDPDSLFGPTDSESRLVLEIGSGFGASLVSMAIAQPKQNVIGCEVHTPGVLATMRAVDAAAISNVRLVHGDAFDFLHRLPPNSLDQVRLFFPDPWPKAGQRHRRMMTLPRISRLVANIGLGGRFHVVTDVEDYALQTERVCGQHRELHGGRIERPPWRFETKFERKARAAGRPTVDLMFTRRRPS